MGKRIAREYLPKFNEEALLNDIQEKRAIPDLIFKFNIFKAHQEMIEAKARMMYNKRALFAGRGSLAGRVDVSDLHDLANKIDSLFCMLKYMILDKLNERGKIPAHKQAANKEKIIYDKLIQLNNGRYIKYSELDLLEMMDFLTKYMHELNFTNLLLSDTDFVKELEDSF